MNIRERPSTCLTMRLSSARELLERARVTYRSAADWISDLERILAGSSAAGRLFFEIPSTRRSPTAAERLEAERERAAATKRRCRLRDSAGIAEENE